MTWLYATLLAACFNSWRTAAQQRGRAQLSLNGAALVRFFYGLPVAVALLALYAAWRGGPLPPTEWSFFGWSAAAGFAQILGTNLLLMAFGYRNYVVGTAYSKTEALQGAILSFLLIGERLAWQAWLGIAIGVAGIITLSTRGERLRLSQIVQPAALCGLGAGLGFTMTSIFVKLATREVETRDLVLAALMALVATQATQVAMQGGYLLIREPGEMRRVLASWRTSALVGALSSLGSASWFTGFALAPVALVRTVGQVEVFFTLGFGHFYLREAVRWSEVLGLLLVGAGVVLALAGSL